MTIARICVLIAAAVVHEGCALQKPRPPKTPEQQAREVRCMERLSYARCQLAAAGIHTTLKDVEVPRERFDQLAGGARAGAIADFALATGNLTGSISPVGGIASGLSGALNLASGFITLTQSDEGQFDRTLAFIPQDLARDGTEAEALFEKALTEAYVKAIPGATDAMLEQITHDGYRRYVYVIHGGLCDVHTCWVVGPWSRVCARNEECRPHRRPWVLQDAYGHLGTVKVWQRHDSRADTIQHLVIAPGKDESISAVGTHRRWPTGLGVPPKTEFMAAVARNSPSWMAFFLAQSSRNNVRMPVLLDNRGPHYFIVPGRG